MKSRTLSAALLVGLTLANGSLSAQHRVGYFVEAAGSGGFGSLNLEFRPIDRLQLRGGAGLILVFPTMPFTATYSLGSGRRSLEVGGGATLMLFPRWDDLGVVYEKQDNLKAVFVPSAVIAYRYEAPSGYFFRAALTPFFPRGHRFFWGGISMGGVF